MANATQFYQTTVAQVTQFVSALENLQLLADRIAADSSLSAAAAAAAQPGRPDLSTADFDNFRAAVNAVTTLLNSNSPSVNAATVRLPFYKMM